MKTGQGHGDFRSSTFAGGIRRESHGNIRTTTAINRMPRLQFALDSAYVLRCSGAEPEE
jgi:hypothetical protein